MVKLHDALFVTSVVKSNFYLLPITPWWDKISYQTLKMGDGNVSVGNALKKKRIIIIIIIIFI